MTKYRPYSRRELRRRRWAWAKRNLKLFGLLTAATIGLLAAVTALLMAASPTAFTWYVLGAIHVGTIVIYLHALDATFLAHDREAIFHVRGAWGEENTRDELNRAKRRRLIWGRVDSISLEVGDLDHLVVTRRGGLVAIDSKWRNQLDPSDTFDMARAGKKVRQRAEARGGAGDPRALEHLPRRSLGQVPSARSLSCVQSPVSGRADIPPSRTQGSASRQLGS